MSIEKKHLIIIGMMGTGKTTVGQKLAEELPFPWKDTDREIEKRSGMTVAQFFERFGEEEFRSRESDELKRLLEGDRSIITTGGGIVLKKENRERIKQGGWVIHLTADPDVIVQRAKQAADTRPLLLGNLREKVMRIAKEREGMYDFADWSIDTSLLHPGQVVDEILRFCERKGFKARS